MYEKARLKKVLMYPKYEIDRQSYKETLHGKHTDDTHYDNGLY